MRVQSKYLRGRIGLPTACCADRERETHTTVLHSDWVCCTVFHDPMQTTVSDHGANITERGLPVCIYYPFQLADIIVVRALVEEEE